MSRHVLKAAHETTRNEETKSKQLIHHFFPFFFGLQSFSRKVLFPRVVASGGISASIGCFSGPTMIMSPEYSRKRSATTISDTEFRSGLT